MSPPTDKKAPPPKRSLTTPTKPLPQIRSSLETRSTLKFAQRAKFTKNNAIVNEDGSGDVLAMRMQIQQLKKEVSHLRDLLNGGPRNHDPDNLSMGLVASPGTFKWEGLSGMFSPLPSDKRLSQKDFEVALVGAFKRLQDKDMALQALAAENQAAMQLVDDLRAKNKALVEENEDLIELCEETNNKFIDLCKSFVI